MKIRTMIAQSLAALALLPGIAHAETVVHRARSGGVGALWMLCNISYAGMRAQDSANSGWRMLAFIFGLPGTLLTFFVVAEGSERAYGIELPTARSNIPPIDDTLGL